MVLKPRILRIGLAAIAAWLVVAGLAPRLLVGSAPLASADAIVVMSGSSAYRERTKKAAELYHEGRAPLVVLTDDHTQGGWSSAQQRNPYFVERARDELINLGVPEDRIRIAPGDPTGTWEEAIVIKNYAASQGFRSVLIVTSSYHSRRALRTIRRVFAGTETTVGLEPAPASSVSAFWWLRQDGWRTIGGEYVKLIYYWFVYE